MNFLDESYWGNIGQQWLLAGLIVIVTYVVLTLIKRFLVRRFRALAKRTKTDIDDLVVDLVRRTRFFVLVLIALYVGTLALVLPPDLKKLMGTVTTLVMLLQAAIWGNGILMYLINRATREKMAEDAAGATTISALGFLSKLVLWSVVMLLALDNLGFNITALVAGLGIGGIAVALAVQNVLGDLFASLSIILDKPFVIGDFIIVDEYLGTVEHVGLKTTRIRSLSGEQIVFSNNDLLSSRVRNYKKMFQRRILFEIGVTYQTPADKLETIGGMIREVIEAQADTRFDRSHFKSYGDFSLNFETVYYMLKPDYTLYMDTQERINLGLLRRFEKEGIEFAYPTQTLFVEKIPRLSDDL
jgi:small-conductance mechanosensitive channel